jgi:hypothetical protein
MSLYRIFMRCVCLVCAITVLLTLGDTVVYLPAKLAGIHLSPALIGTLYAVGVPIGGMYILLIFGAISDEKDMLRTGLEFVACGLLVGAGVFLVGQYGLDFVWQTALRKPQWLAAAVLPLLAVVALEIRLTYSDKRRCSALLAAVSQRLVEDYGWAKAHHDEYEGGWAINVPGPYGTCWFKTRGDDCSVWRLTTGGRGKDADWKQFDLAAGAEKLAGVIAASIAALFPLASRGLESRMRVRIKCPNEPEIHGQTGEILYFTDTAPAYPEGLPELVATVELENGDKWEIEADHLYPLVPSKS